MGKSINWNKVNLSINIAKEMHRGQTRKYTGMKYVCHPLRVMSYVISRDDASTAMICAAALHDVIEDGPLGFDENYKLVKNNLGKKIADMVMDLSKDPADKAKGMKRGERNTVYKQKLLKASKEVKIIKLLDRLDNVRSRFDMDPDFWLIYKRETEDLLDAIGDVCQETSLIIKMIIEAKAP